MAHDSFLTRVRTFSNWYAAVMGTGIVGWLDPFSLLVRSVGLSSLGRTRTQQTCRRSNRGQHTAFHPRRCNQQVILRSLPAFVAVRFNELLASLALRFEAAEEMMNGAERADPPAEETSE